MEHAKKAVGRDTFIYGNRYAYGYFPAVVGVCGGDGNGNCWRASDIRKMVLIATGK